VDGSPFCEISADFYVPPDATVTMNLNLAVGTVTFSNPSSQKQWQINLPETFSKQKVFLFATLTQSGDRISVAAHP
jgi:hypothetical protein